MLPSTDAASRAALAARIDGALPQTQCTRCGFPDCRSYAEAVAQDGAAINRCPPGGTEGIARLSKITGRPAVPLDPDYGVEGPRFMAVIDEAWCIGCTLCLDACPTDAIVGIHKKMHTVIEAHCTGCELCIPVCPVDCIALEDATPSLTGWQAWSPAQADAAQQRYLLHTARQQRKVTVPAEESPSESVADPQTRKRSIVEAALARARAAAARSQPPSDT